MEQVLIHEPTIHANSTFKQADRTPAGRSSIPEAEAAADAVAADVVLAEGLAVAGEVFHLEGGVEMKPVGELKPEIKLPALMIPVFAHAELGGEGDGFPADGAEDIAVTPVVCEIGIIITDGEVIPGARLEAERKIIRGLIGEGGLEINGIQAALFHAAATIGLVLHAGLQIELGINGLQGKIGIVKERGGLVAGVIKRRVFGDEVPKGGLGVGKIEVGQRVVFVRKGQDLVFEAELKFCGGIGAEEEINGFVGRNVFIQEFHELLAHLRTGTGGRWRAQGRHGCQIGGGGATGDGEQDGTIICGLEPDGAGDTRWEGEKIFRFAEGTGGDGDGVGARSGIECQSDGGCRSGRDQRTVNRGWES